jgi:hypothetical protein
VYHPYFARVPNSAFAKMSDDAWQAIGNIASTTGITVVAYSGVKGVVAGYQAYTSAPHTSLTESERKLKRVRSRLHGLSPQRREEIESATLNESPNCTSLRGLEVTLEMCVLLIYAVPLEFKFTESLVSWTRTVD